MTGSDPILKHIGALAVIEQSVTAIMTHSWGPRSNNSNSFVPFSEDETSRGSLELNIFGMPRDGIISMGELVQAQPDDGILHTACSGGGALLSTQDN